MVMLTKRRTVVPDVRQGMYDGADCS